MKQITYQLRTVISDLEFVKGNYLPIELLSLLIPKLSSLSY